jgi:hypothetical protein
MKYLFALTLTILSFFTRAQELTQTIRGTLKDQDTQAALIGATVQLAGTNPVVGTIADMNGEFRINNVPLGRVTLLINYIGYEEKVIPNLLVSSAKEVVLQITMIESVDKLDEVVVSAKRNKAEVLNEMSLTSARSFSVDETQRYAGSFADPARMVASFAGVTNQAEGNNDIIVRGNSPRGILWRLEGMEIPNPNHFAGEGATGGPINALNSNMLSDSDFMSGAFAPEYGNAMSGVFDMKLKKGNNEQREYTATASTLGFDFTVEGPFKNGYNGSYLANYRYSSLAVLDGLGIISFGGVPKYQDASFNVNLPINKNHYITMFGLGGISSISGEDENDDGVVIDQSTFGAKMGVVGLTHNYLINDRSFLKTSVSAAGTSLVGEYDLPNTGSSGFYNVYNSDLSKTFLRAATTFNYKFNARHKVETGIIYTGLGFDMLSNTWNFEREEMEVDLDDSGSSYSLQGFTSWKYRITEDLTFIGGLHYMQFGLNNASSLEPRAALKWAVSDRRSFSAGFGLHSKLESMSVYLAKQVQDDGTILTPNRNLGLSRAAHYVVGYDQSFNANTHLKVEAYYQHLFDVPIERNTSSYFSLLNQSDYYSTESLVNNGTGTNYGLELTLERYLHRGLYYMASASLYESLYTGSDGVERQTVFAGNYIFNVLGGKEWKVGRAEKNKVLFVNSKISLIGGKKYTPIDLEASIELGDEVLQEDRPYSVKGDDVFIMNFSIGTRRNKRNTTREFKIDVQNVTNNQAVIDQYYLNATQEIEESYQLSLLPTISYTFRF